MFVRELSFGTLGWSQARKERRGIIYQGCATGLESKIVRACLVSLVLVIDAYFSLVVPARRKPSTLSRAVGLRQKAFYLRLLSTFAAPPLLPNDNVHNSSAPESFTIAWSTRMRRTRAIWREGVEGERTPEKCRKRADVRRHGKLFTKPSSKTNFKSARDLASRYMLQTESCAFSIADIF